MSRLVHLTKPGSDELRARELGRLPVFCQASKAGRLPSETDDTYTVFPRSATCLRCLAIAVDHYQSEASLAKLRLDDLEEAAFQAVSK